MKTNLKKALAIFLCTVMTLSCLGIFGFAATKENVYQYGAGINGGYLALGDSIDNAFFAALK